MTIAMAKNLADWAISSQAAKKLVEGSTTREISANVKSSVKSPRMGRACEIANIGDMMISMIKRDELNNHPDNLEVMTLAEHTRTHHKGKAKI